MSLSSITYDLSASGSPTLKQYGGDEGGFGGLALGLAALSTLARLT